MSGDKKIVRAKEKDRPGSTRGGAPVWEATPEARKRALIFRIVAGALWLIAIGVELYLIFGVLMKDNSDGFPMTRLIVLLVVMGVLSVVGSLLWKRANHMDPASEKDKVRFFVQNQLGAFVAVVAFLPLVVLILLNDDMDKNQKTIAGGIAGVILVVATLVGIDFDSASVERYTIEAQWDRQRVIAMTGEDEVFWVDTGRVFHLCAEVSPLQKTSTATEIKAGTVQAAIDGGMERLTKQIQMEINQCGLDQPDPKYLENDPPADFTEILESGSAEDEESGDDDREVEDDGTDADEPAEELELEDAN